MPSSHLSDDSLPCHMTSPAREDEGYRMLSLRHVKASWHIFLISAAGVTPRGGGGWGLNTLRGQRYASPSLYMSSEMTMIGSL